MDIDLDWLNRLKESARILQASEVTPRIVFALFEGYCCDGGVERRNWGHAVACNGVLVRIERQDLMPVLKLWTRIRTRRLVPYDHVSHLSHHLNHLRWIRARLEDDGQQFLTIEHAFSFFGGITAFQIVNTFHLFVRDVRKAATIVGGGHLEFPLERNDEEEGEDEDWT